MTKKIPPSSVPNNGNPRALHIDQLSTETLADALAHSSLRPSVQAALTLMEYNKTFGEVSLDTLINDLVKQCTLANKGDLSRAEATLTAQAHTLDAIFNNLARRAALNAGEYMGACETYLRLALKAQSQCRATLETLAAIKNPQPVAFVKQANFANGPQQVNNTEAVASPRAEKSKIQPNKVLEQQHGERLDFGTSDETSRTNSALETVEAIHRTQNTSG